MDIQTARPVWRVATAVALAVAGSNAAWSAEPGAREEELAEVVVTGSRIVRRDYESQSPIVTMQSETFENRSAVTVEAALQQLPQFAPSAGAQANSGSSTPFPSATASPGAATLNLRGLGSNRNLVLVDGRRVQPINGNLTVDLNTIPSAAVQSVEVISGGAAAVYGADAISGVVNLILKKNYEGATFDAQYGITEQGDGEQYQFSALLGANYGDGRGNVMFGGSYAYRGSIHGKDRDWVRAGWRDPGTPAAGASNVANLSLFRCTRAGAAIGTCSSAWLPVQNGSGYSVDQNGNVYDASDPLNPAHPYTGPISYESGYKINPNGSLGYFDKDASALSVPLERYSLFASTNYQLGNGVEFFTDARFTKTHTIAYGTHISLFNIWAMNVPYNQAYDDPDSPTFGQGPPAPNGTPYAHHPVPRGLADILNSRNIANPLTSPWLYEGGVDYLPRYRTETTTNVFQLIAGLRGDLPFRDWTWEIYGSHGDTNVEAYLPESFLSMSNMQVLFNANQYGQGWTNPQTLTVTGSCPEGLPIFNPDGSVDNTPYVSQQCSDWVTLRMNNSTNISQEILEFGVQGSLFELWAGPVQFAAGGMYRAEEYRFTPDAAYNANQAAANVVNNIALPLGVNGQNHVSEVYGELLIPLLADVPFVKKLEIDPAYRLSDYKTSGSISTWKVTAVWQMFDWVTLRGGFQKATRAPNLNELFMPVGAASIQGSIDGCGNWTNSPTWANVPGNPNRLNVQILCEHLMQRDGAPAPFPLYVPGGSANSYAYTVFGANNPTAPFNFDLGIQGGNPNLDPEKAETITAGLVLKSPFEADLVRRLTLAVDYYDIDLKGAIGVPTGAQVYQQCLNAQFNPLVGDAAGSHTGAELAAGNPYCALIRREYTGLPSGSFGADRRYMANYVNLGGIKTSGIDVQLDWAVNLGFVPGSFTTNLQYNKLNEFKQSPFAGAPYTERKGTWDAGFNYDWQLLSTFGYVNGPYSVGLRWSHKPGLNPPSSAAAGTVPVSSYDLFDLFGRWAVNSKFEVRAGVDNLLDKDPERFGANTGINAQGVLIPGAVNNALGTSVVGQDTFGRRYFVALKISL